MSSGSHDVRARVLGELVRELRQFHGLGASYLRVAAGRLGMPVTDLQVLESLAASGPTTAGQLAELTGLTTGAIAGMLNRLEKAGYVRRERDPNDGRRVIVQLESGAEAPREVSALLDAIARAWEERAAAYDEQQLALLRDYLRNTNALFMQEMLRLREGPQGEGETYSAPLGDVASGQLVTTGAPRLTVRGDDSLEDLYQARFEGPLPEVKASDATVSIRYPRRLWVLGGGMRSASAEVALSTAIPWRILIQGAAAVIGAELQALTLSDLEVKGAMSMVRLDLPAPSGVVPIRISGSAAEIVVRRPAGVAARVHLKGWVSTFIFDDQTFGNMGNNVRLHSPDWTASAPCYEIEVSSSASMVTIATT